MDSEICVSGLNGLCEFRPSYFFCVTGMLKTKSDATSKANVVA